MAGSEIIESVSATDSCRWYALHTRARHEKAISERLTRDGIETFLPIVIKTHHWSDRKKTVHLPLFSCYVFVKLARSSNERIRAERTPGALGIVGVRGEGIPIPDEQLDSIRRVISQQALWSLHPFLRIGQRVRIRGGSMDGIEGVLLARNGDRTLIVSIDAIQRSLAVRVEGYDVEPV